ncbi:MAG: DUF4349 domain-containing protein [Deltaproteobacteria bacterium]|nr:DUF4349 domain-containing protein [Candidatus Zymogenaceae bacterium]
MKPKNISLTVLITLCLVVIPPFISSCSKDSPEGFVGMDKSLEMVMETADMEPPAAAPPSPMTGTSDDASIPAMERKVIKRAELDIEVKDSKEAFSSVQDIINEVDGFIADSSSYKSDAGSLSYEVTLRVTPDRFDSVIDRISDLGELEYEHISGEDITEMYYDIEGRLKVKRRSEESLLAIMSTRTTNLQDLLAVEKELARVREEIETLEGKLRYYDNLVGLSTITVSLFEPEPITAGRNFLSPIKDALGDSVEVLARSVGGLIIIFMAILPWAIVAVIVFLIIRTIVRKRREKNPSPAKASDAKKS